MAEYIEREAIQKRLNRIVEVNNLRTDLAWFTPYGVNALIEEIPAADVRPVKWKSVREHTPEPGRYLTCRKTSTIPHSYYQSILSYTDNLESVDEYDFEGENVPGWFEYDSEYGYYSCDNVEWFMPLPPMPTNCGARMEES